MNVKDEQLHTLLMYMLSGEAKEMVRNVAPSGIEAWRTLNHRWNRKTQFGATQIAEMIRTIAPAKSVEDVYGKINQLERLHLELQKNLGEDIVNGQLIKVVYGEAFKKADLLKVVNEDFNIQLKKEGKELESMSYQELVDKVQSYVRINAKGKAKMDMGMIDIAGNINLNSDGEKEDEKEEDFTKGDDEEDWKHDEGWIGYMGYKGNSKGKGKGFGGKGYKGDGKGFGKSGGKAWPSRFEGNCHSCGKYGHRSAECRGGKGGDSAGKGYGKGYGKDGAGKGDGFKGKGNGMNNFNNDDMYAQRPQPIGGNGGGHQNYYYPNLMHMGSPECHHLFHIEHKSEGVEQNSDPGQKGVKQCENMNLYDWVKIALKGEKQKTKSKCLNSKPVETNNKYELLGDNDPPRDNELMKVISDSESESEGTLMKVISDSESESETGKRKLTRNQKKKMKRKMLDLVDSDQESEKEEDCGSSRFDSRQDVMTAAKQKTFGSKTTVNATGANHKREAGSNCGSRFGSGSSQIGCQFREKDDMKDKRLINLLEEKSETRKGITTCDQAKRNENVINNVEEGWELISVLIDSGSTETVAPKDSLRGYELMSTDWSEAGKGYSAANGSDIPNLGEKIVKGQAMNGMWCTMRFQICEVTKPLGSVSRICQAGSRVVFGPPNEGSYIEHVTTGKRTVLRQCKGLYYLDVWVAPADTTSTFTRQGNNM